MGKTFEELSERFRSIRFDEEFDMIVAVANGGIIPAAFLNQRLNVEVQLLRINLRDNCQKPLYDTPKLLSPVYFDVENKSILLVEDRVKTGASLNFAKNLLQKAKLIKTFAVNGNADYFLYNEDCFKFPWIL
ncbi:MAG: phosphoribosyltransferase [Prevotellaceae bacterium]|jgi:xanthine phosphoribosyltransferase|nr:phosphoribosyltransferase [Prevotellaceae bacterium]